MSRTHQIEKSGTNFLNLREKIKRNKTYVDLLKEFGVLTASDRRVDYVLEIINSCNINIDLQTDGKNDTLAVALRERGNVMFERKKLKLAWEYYTRSICHSEENSVNLGLAYARRSEILLKAKLQKECLQDIQRALANNCPADLQQQLKTRENQANNIKHGASEEPHQAVPTVINENSKIQCASDSIEIRENQDFGRHVVAVKDIKAGEILAVEKPFASYLLSDDENFIHCHECVELCYNLIPCKGCTYAMYCSEACRNQAFATYHKYECPILATLRFLNHEPLYLPLKIAFLAKDQCGKSLVNLDQEMYCSDSYKAIHNLISHTSKRTVADLFEKSIAAAVVFNLVKKNTDFFRDSDVKLEAFFKEVVLLHMQTGPLNFYEITELVPDSLGLYEPKQIASGVYAFLSLLNHSCYPNVIMCCYGSKVVLRAIRDIQKGEQCFDNYGYHFAGMDRTKRRENLQREYFFNCMCQACENNWPLYDALPSVSSEDEDESVMMKLSEGDVKTAESVLQDFLTRLGELQKLQVSQDSVTMESHVNQCFHVLGNKRRIR